ncbi:hypothetical protein [uncultured Olsenella sp.]|uniref:hypothetical protein n=1 Tax=uncultured Olsenella sp. TaxID=190764 RepID=UPI0026DBFD2D|nr:hypothetical protein [uncultured Olsenella sp.]
MHVLGLGLPELVVLAVYVVLPIAVIALVGRGVYRWGKAVREDLDSIARSLDPSSSDGAPLPKK